MLGAQASCLLRSEGDVSGRASNACSPDAASPREQARCLRSQHAEDDGSWGEISAEGGFVAGEGVGNFVVTATSGEKSGTATVTIASVGEDELGEIEIPPATKLTWSGEIPAQK